MCLELGLVNNMNKLKIFILILGVSATIGIVAQQLKAEPLGVHLENPQVVVWNKPVTDAQWAEDVRKESLDLKFDYQLTEMKISHEKKLPHVEEDLREITECPDCIRWQLRQQFEADFDDMELGYSQKFEGKTVQQWIDGEFAEQMANRTWKVEKVSQSIERIDNEIRLRDSGFLKVLRRFSVDSPARKNLKANERSPLGTAFYVDETAGVVSGAGTATTSAFATLDEFTEVARNAGDIVFVRRVATTTVRLSDLLFSSDGTIENPIIITADYDNLWSDFATSSQTVTPVFGSKFMATSASTTDMFPNQWIYVAGDCAETFSATTINDCDFAYEIELATTTGIKLYLPYKGDQSSAGTATRVMGVNPQWNIVTGNFQWSFDPDDNWKVQGIHIRGTDANGNVEIDSATKHVFKDVIFEGNGTADHGIISGDDTAVIQVIKSRFFDHDAGLQANAGTRDFSKSIIKDSFLDGNNVVASRGIVLGTWTTITIIGSEFQNYASGDISFSSGVSGAVAKTRNTSLTSSTEVTNVQSCGNNCFNSFFAEDNNGVVGDNRQINRLSTAEGSPVIKSTTTPLRSGGGATSIEVLPSTAISSDWEWSRILLFEYPVHTDTTSRDYQVFFKAGTTTVEFATSPTADELWIECEYWGHASNNFRRLKKTTATMDFTTDADFDQSLTITCNPSQTGILYLRVWYAKTKESDFDNVFFVDPRPVITDT